MAPKSSVRVAALAGLAVLAGCQYSDIAAFRNTTTEPLILRAEVEGEFARYDCGGSGSDLIRFEGETEIDIRPGQSMCLEGPATSFDDTYDVRDLLVVVAITREDTVCVELEGDALFDELVPDGRFKTLLVDEERCPGEEEGPEAADEGEAS